MIKYYLLLLPLIFFLCINTPITKHKIEWFYKKILILIGLICISISMLKNNIINDKYILPIILYINIAILIYVTLNNTFNYINLLPLIGIIYLLYTFNYNDFLIKNGILVRPNKKWIIESVIVLILYYLLSSNKIISIKNKLWFSLLIVFPLLFPIKYYFIHRVFTLSLAISLYKYIV